MDDMSDMTSQDARDTAFDAQCRDLLQGRTEVAPAPADDLFADAGATRSSGRRIGVAAVVLLGAAAWGISQYSTEEPVTEPVDEAAVLADIRKRDERDSNRAAAPLKAAPDAHVLDTSALDIEGAVKAALAIIENARGGR